MNKRIRNILGALGSTVMSARQNGSVTEIELQGEIVGESWFEEGSNTKLRAALKAAGGDVVVMINSPGGDVYAGADIYTALRDHRAKGHDVTVKVTGEAASAASLISMAASKVVMSPVSTMMIHNPWTIALGNAREMRNVANTLDVIRDAMLYAYVNKTGMKAEKIKEMLDAETTMTAQTCVELGFADAVEDWSEEKPANSKRMSRNSEKDEAARRFVAMVAPTLIESEEVSKSTDTIEEVENLSKNQDSVEEPVSTPEDETEITVEAEKPDTEEVNSARARNALKLRMLSL